MGIWRRSGCCRGGFCEDRRAPRTADDSGELAAAALDGLIGDWSVMSCERCPAPGQNDREAGHGMLWRTDAARRREGRPSDHVLMPAPEGGARGAAPRAETSTMILRPPRQGL